MDYITVTEPGTGGDTMHVAGLVVTRKVSGYQLCVDGHGGIEDASGAPVASATVTLLATRPGKRHLQRVDPG